MAIKNECSDYLQLAEILINRRNSDSFIRSSKGEISDSGIRKLLQIAYYVSLSPEEGRYSSFRLFVDTQSLKKNRELLISFNPAVLLTKENLRRLVPSIQTAKHALYIIEEDDKLKCKGVMLFNTEVLGLGFFRPELAMPSVYRGTMVSVFGPGHIRATELFPTYELKGGAIKQIKHYKSIKIIEDWFSEISEEIWDNATKYQMEKTEFNTKKNIVDTISSLWSHVLISTIERKHGGAFIIIPEKFSFNNIERKYYASGIDLSESISKFWRTCLEGAGLKEENNKEICKRAIRWNLEKNKLFCDADTISNLSNVDGCVLLNRKLKLISFGCEIKVEENELKHAKYYKGDTENKFFITKYGTRHRSAARICAVNPGALAFVISQDGGFKIFYGQDKERVNVWQSKSAWMRSTDIW